MDEATTAAMQYVRQRFACLAYSMVESGSDVASIKSALSSFLVNQDSDTLDAVVTAAREAYEANTSLTTAQTIYAAATFIEAACGRAVFTNGLYSYEMAYMIQRSSFLSQCLKSPVFDTLTTAGQLEHSFGYGSEFIYYTKRPVTKGLFEEYIAETKVSREQIDAYLKLPHTDFSEEAKLALADVPNSVSYLALLQYLSFFEGYSTVPAA